jgi:hypothetical protein
VLVAAFQLNAQSAEEVILYYANETSPEGSEKASYDTIVSWLRELGTEKANRIDKNLEADQIKFPAMVEKEAEALSTLKAQVYVFDNKLARRNVYLFKGGDKPVSKLRLPVELPATTDPILENNPLSNPEMLRKVLDWLALEIKQDHPRRIGLIFKSHGNHFMALTPRVCVWASSISKERLSHILNEAEDAVPAQRAGISREQFYNSISAFQAAAQQPIDFVILESCGASPEKMEYRLGRHVRSFFANASQKAEYAEIDYQQALQGSAGTPVEALIRHLRTNVNFREYREENSSFHFIKLSLFFLPLLIVASAWIFMRAKATRLKNRGAKFGLRNPEPIAVLTKPEFPNRT